MGYEWWRGCRGKKGEAADRRLQEKNDDER